MVFGHLPTLQSQWLIVEYDQEGKNTAFYMRISQRYTYNSQSEQKNGYCGRFSSSLAILCWSLLYISHFWLDSCVPRLNIPNVHVASSIITLTWMICHSLQYSKLGLYSIYLHLTLAISRYSGTVYWTFMVIMIIVQLCLIVIPTVSPSWDFSPICNLSSSSPGPGLAIRVLCMEEPFFEKEREYAETQFVLRIMTDFANATKKPHALVNRVKASLSDSEQEMLHRMSLERQLHALLLPVRTVGVQGDCRTYSYVAAISSNQPPNWPSLFQLTKLISKICHNVNRYVMKHFPSQQLLSVWWILSSL